MLGYVAFVAILNIFLGYALAVFLGSGGGTLANRSARGQAAREPEDALALDATMSTAGDVAGDSPAAGEENTEPLLHPQASPTSEEDPPLDGIDSIDQQQPIEADGPSDPNQPVERAGSSVARLSSRADAEQLLADLALVKDPARGPTSVALVELDGAQDEGPLITDRLLSGVVSSVCELLAETHLAARYDDRQYLLVLVGEDESHATRRTEQLRQRIESTEFVADEEAVHATVTCALAQVSSDLSIPRQLDALQVTLEEAKRYGGNRTFLYDGVSPAPVVPPELDLDPVKRVI